MAAKSDKLSDRERRYYILALTTMASADKHAAKEELEFIQRRCKQLKCRLTKKDFKAYDLEKIARVITNSKQRSELFQDLIAMAKADRKWDPAELQILKFFSERWKQPLPSIKGVTWDSIDAPKEAATRDLSKNKRAQLEKREELPRATDPGMRWGWVFASIIVFVAAVAGSLFAAGKWWQPINIDTLVAHEPILFLFLLAPCLVSGLLVGIVSPGRTVREPAIGILITLLLVFGVLALAVLPDAEGAGYGLLLAISGASTVAMFILALIGAWIGELVTGN